MLKAKENFRNPCCLKFSSQRCEFGEVHLELTRYYWSFKRFYVTVGRGITV